MQSVSSVVIVGGGSAGWLAALALDTYCPFLRLRLVRPRQNNPIGVGESTQTDFVRLLTAAGVDMQAFYKVTRYLERHLRQVEVIEADRIDIETAEGRISHLVLDGGNRISADLYVDCTGFARALLKRVATPEIMPYEPNVNRAAAAQVPYLDRAPELLPITRAHAHQHGWTWTIPLQSRIGSGYVHHDGFCSPEDAEKNFRAYWGEERMRDVDVKHIAFGSSTHPSARRPGTGRQR